MEPVPVAALSRPLWRGHLASPECLLQVPQVVAMIATLNRVFVTDYSKVSHYFDSRIVPPIILSKTRSNAEPAGSRISRSQFMPLRV